jgi:TRAP-type C4-dicarboxylate transport system permease small subunit
VRTSGFVVIVLVNCALPGKSRWMAIFLFCFVLFCFLVLFWGGNDYVTSLVYLKRTNMYKWGW